MIPATWAAARDVSPEELIGELARDAPYWARSGGGITLSGGEPLLQAGAVARFLACARGAGHPVAVDTAGAVAASAIRQVAPGVSHWLWDVKAVSPHRAETGTGDDLQRARANLSWVLSETETPVWLRLPLIADFNAADAELVAIAAWVAALPRVPPLHILPGHRHGAIKRDREPPGRIVPAPDEVDRAVRVFEKGGVRVFVAPEEPPHA
jgi:pyruvate formate lyase activating enzyme